ncbi:hypothetical protein KEM52_004278 [Ascosphaera acerosa]|nr:hypothetical protein KEM52_004278 [Ascosphaera acerosa]
MARGNQREKSREKTAKAEAAKGRRRDDADGRVQKKKNTMSGAEFARAKEEAAAIMRAKQAAAEARKAEAGKKK